MENEILEYEFVAKSKKLKELCIPLPGSVNMDGKVEAKIFRFQMPLPVKKGVRYRLKYTVNAPVYFYLERWDGAKWVFAARRLDN